MVPLEEEQVYYICVAQLYTEYPNKLHVHACCVYAN